MVKGNRTKGNTKPSSSRRTAELLASSGSGTEAVNTFVGFSSLSSTAAEEEDFDNDFKVVFKKMSKKDCITKVKALQEFQRLVIDKSDINLRPILVQWPRIYSKLAIDNDWRVREATHKSQEQLAVKVGKSIAPHLKQLVPIWLTSQYDPYTPAATAAISSFETAFPGHKKINVLVIFKTPIITYIKDMLLNQTIESVSEDTATPEENKSKYNRLISNCLQGLSALIGSLPTDSIPEIQDTVQDLVNNQKFWKLSKFADSLVRSSWFRVMSSFAQHLPQVFASNASKICGLTLGGLDEKDFLVVGSVWECALLSVITIEDCWKFVNFRKAFYPQLRAILREGGRGSAVTIFPNLLPLLSRIPYESSDNFIEFNKEFFGFLREGLEKTVLKSQSESNAIIKAFMECLRFSICSKTIDDIQQKNEFQSFLIQKELLPLIEESISNNDCLSKTSLFEELSHLWLYLSKEDKYEEPIRQISDKLIEICLTKIGDKNYKPFARISRMFYNLFCDSIAQKKDKKIRFRRDSDEDDYRSQQIFKSNDLISDRLAANVLNVVVKALIDGYNVDHNNHHFLELLLHLFKVQTKDNFNRLLTELNMTSFDEFWTVFIKQWFSKCSLNSESKEKSQLIKTLIEMTAILLAFVEEKQRKYNLLNEILTLNDPFLTESLISTIIKSKDKFLSEWLKTESTGSSIVLMTSKLIENIIGSSTDPSEKDLDILWKLISHCFSDTSFDRLSTEKVINKLCISLKNCCSSSKSKFIVDFTCGLASQLFKSYELCTSLASARELLLTIFSINCRLNEENTHLTNAWRDGVRNIVKSNGAYLCDDGIITKLILEIRSRLQSNIISLENSEQVSECGFELIDTIYKTISSSDATDEDLKKSFLSDPNIIMILDIMLLKTSEWNQLKNECDYSVLHYDCLNGETLLDADNCQMVSKESFDTTGIPFVFSAVATGLLIEKLLTNYTTLELSPDLIQMFANQLSYLLVATDYVSIKSLSDKTKKFSTILSVLTKSLKSIFDLDSHGLTTKVGQLLLEKSVDENGIMSQTFGYFIDNFYELDESQYQLSFENLNYSRIITFQKYCSHLPQNRLNETLKQSLNLFLCCERFVQLEDGIAKLAVLHSCLKHLNSESEEVSEVVNSLMETFKGLKVSNNNQFYTQNNIEANSDLQFYCLIIQIFEVIVDRFTEQLSHSHWDFILISTTSWIMNIDRQYEKLSNDLSLNIFAVKVFKLVQTIAKKFDNLAETKFGVEGVELLLLEWNEFHSQNIYQILFRYYFEFCKQFEKENGFYDEILFKYLSKAVVFIPNQLIVEYLVHLPNKETPEIESIPDNYQFVCLPEERENFLKIFCQFLFKGNIQIALTSHQMILKLIPFLDSTQPELKEEEENEIFLSPPKTLLSYLQQTDHIIDQMLIEYPIGTFCSVQPNTDSFTYTFAYLLLWVEVLELMSSITADKPTLRSQYQDFLRDSDLLSRLLKNLFRLMPLSGGECPKILSPNLFERQFTRHSVMSIDEPSDSSHIQRLSCHLYYLLLRRVPASVREWCRNSDRNTSDIVNHTTSTYFSPYLCAEELIAVKEADSSDFNNMEVKSRHKTREVLAKYTFEEMSFELNIPLPENYPLGTIVCQCVQKIGVKTDEWRKWMLQLHNFINNLNGSILDGLMAFKKNVDQRFKGVEECLICFYVLNGKTLDIPRKECYHCHKHFHDYCLFKWFKTSNHEFCPNCRQLWRWRAVHH